MNYCTKTFFILDSVVRCLEGVEPESLPEVVVVPDLFDAVVLDVQPLQVLGDEGVVEPLELVVRHVQPLEVMLVHEKTVDVLELVVIEPECLKQENAVSVSS